MPNSAICFKNIKTFFNVNADCEFSRILKIVTPTPLPPPFQVGGGVGVYGFFLGQGVSKDVVHVQIRSQVNRFVTGSVTTTLV